MHAHSVREGSETLSTSKIKNYLIPIRVRLGPTHSTAQPAPRTSFNAHSQAVCAIVCTVRFLIFLLPVCKEGVTTNRAHSGTRSPRLVHPLRTYLLITNIRLKSQNLAHYTGVTAAAAGWTFYLQAVAMETCRRPAATDGYLRRRHAPRWMLD